MPNITAVLTAASVLFFGSSAFARDWQEVANDSDATWSVDTYMLRSDAFLR